MFSHRRRLQPGDAVSAAVRRDAGRYRPSGAQHVVRSAVQHHLPVFRYRRAVLGRPGRPTRPQTDAAAFSARYGDRHGADGHGANGLGVSRAACGAGAARRVHSQRQRADRHPGAAQPQRLGARHPVYRRRRRCADRPIDRRFVSRSVRRSGPTGASSAGSRSVAWSTSNKRATTSRACC